MPRISANMSRLTLSSRIQQKLRFCMRSKRLENKIRNTPNGTFKVHVQSDDYMSKLMQMLDMVMLLQVTFIELGEHVIHSRRLQLLLIFLHAGMNAVYNAYYLVVYLLRFAFTHEEYVLPVRLSFLYYGFNIAVSILTVTITIYGFSLVYNSLQETIRSLNKFHIVARDERLKTRLSQFAVNLNSSLQRYTIFGLYTVDGSLLATMISGTVTYIIILIQYGGAEGDIVCRTSNQLNQTIAN